MSLSDYFHRRPTCQSNNPKTIESCTEIYLMRRVKIIAILKYTVSADCLEKCDQANNNTFKFIHYVIIFQQYLVMFSLLLANFITLYKHRTGSREGGNTSPSVQLLKLFGLRSLWIIKYQTIRGG